jgi:D-Tyr-tRNAtyr deacylase
MNLGQLKWAAPVVISSSLYGDAAKGRRPSFIDAARPTPPSRSMRRFAAGVAVE